MYILGISAYYHDSAAVLLKDEEIIAAVQEERFSRKKQDASFPSQAISYCLQEANITLEQVDYISFYDKPFIKFERLLETYLTEAPKGFVSFIKAIPIWLKEKLYLKETLSRELKQLYAQANPEANKKDLKAMKKTFYNKLRFSEHHQSHAASAFFPSPFEEAVILTVDGVGEWTTTSIAHGKNNYITFLQEIKFPHSLGLLYSAFTYYLGFKVNSGEYKVMGLAPYGKPRYVELMKKELIDIKEDGSFHLNMKYFNYTVGLTMTNKKLHELFNSAPRKKESPLGVFEMDIAASLQVITQEVMIKLAKYAQKITSCENLCLAGGVALNCVANAKILEENIFKEIWIQPASNDAGAALGTAYSLYYQELQKQRDTSQEIDKMKGSFLGPKYSNSEIKNYLDTIDATYYYIEDENILIDKVSDALKSSKVVAWHSGRMEFGPRALGNRSILADPRDKDMQQKMNLKIKHRESFRPFAPSILSEHLKEWFDIKVNSPYMLLTAQVQKNKQIKTKYTQTNPMTQELSISRSLIPAVTHIDYSARVQSVEEKTNQRYYKLLKSFFNKTDCPILINTSFNVRGEPIVCSPQDSYRCFMRTQMDVLVLENIILYKDEQKTRQETQDWQKEFELD